MNASLESIAYTAEKIISEKRHRLTELLKNKPHNHEDEIRDLLVYRKPEHESLILQKTNIKGNEMKFHYRDVILPQKDPNSVMKYHALIFGNLGICLLGNVLFDHTQTSLPVMIMLGVIIGGSSLTSLYPFARMGRKLYNMNPLMYFIIESRILFQQPKHQHRLTK